MYIHAPEGICVRSCRELEGATNSRSLRGKLSLYSDIGKIINETDLFVIQPNTQSGSPYLIGILDKTKLCKLFTTLRDWWISCSV